MTVYLCPTYACNLNCSHCSIKNQRITTDIDAIVETSKRFNGSEFVLFGGEPLTLDISLLRQLFDNIDITSVSTNLLSMSQLQFQLLKEHHVDIATSWNPNRFNSLQYRSWLSKIDETLAAQLHTTVLITLTHDLFQSNINDVLQDLSRFNCDYFDGVKFEPYVQSTLSLVEEADKWLVDQYVNWHYPYRNVIADDYRNGNMHFCKNIWTIQPDGNAINSCPATEKSVFLNNCLSCKYNKVCRPCIKQNVCTFFKELYKKVKSNEHDSW